jgi:hypothetical protein
MVMNRRKFLALTGTAMTGLWLDGKGLIQLPRRMVIAFSGRCSFCHKMTERVLGIAGVIGRPDRVCNNCIEVCLDILSEHAISMTVGAPSHASGPLMSHGRAELSDSAIEERLQRLRQSQTEAEFTTQLEQLRSVLDGLSGSVPQARHKPVRACSFCDRTQHETQKLIAGPSTFICDLCVGNAGALINMHC